MKRIVAAATLLSGLLANASPVLAQRDNNPNLGHFYMARQQIDIIDDAPAVQDRRTQPGAGSSGQGGGPTRPIALPKAGWQPYSSSLPQGMSGSLPRVVNGVPPKMPTSSGISPNMGRAGAYSNKSKKASSGTGAPHSNVSKTYAPYKGYGGTPTATGGGSNYASGGSSGGSSTAVSGNLLHWKRTGR